MKYMPWRQVESWFCNHCGDCCKPYIVNLTLREWIRLVKLYGPGIASFSINGFYLNKNFDGSCVFLFRFGEKQLCSIQDIKPLACELFPFKVCSSPKYGNPKKAYFDYRGQRFYLYVNPKCRGLTWGESSEQFSRLILSEAIDLRLGFQSRQLHTTSKLIYPKPIHW